MKKQFETFRVLGVYDTNNLTNKEPSCFNGNVSIKKYQITIEEVEEPKEVYEQRLQKLWDECDNFHHWDPLKKEAKNIGYELVGDAGKNKPKK
jgi:hypothetical protein